MAGRVTAMDKSAEGAQQDHKVEAAEQHDEITEPQLKKRELLDRIAERSGVSKQYARPVLDALLEILSEAVAEGREMNLQPLGKIKVQRSKETPNARITVVKIRQGLSGAGAKESVADTAK